MDNQEANGISLLLSNLKELNDYINNEAARLTRINDIPRYRSESIVELAEALSSAQGEFPPIPFNRTNASWNDDYTDLDIVLRYIRPILAKNKLSISQWTELAGDGGTILHTELLHASGQWKESRIKVVPARNDIRTFDSCMADAKRLQAIMLLGASLEGDVKDDGGDLAMVETHQEIALPTEKKLVRSSASYECITAEQLRELEEELDNHIDLATELMEKYSLLDLSSMPASKFKFAIQQIRKFKMYRRGDSDSVR